MKKHDEGYTLPLVMVVLLVLALVAVTIMTTSLHNMQRQQGFIEQMKAQYDAQGKIEEIVAKLEAGQLAKIPFAAPVKPENNTLSGMIVVTSTDKSVTIKCGVKISAEKIEETSESNSETTDDTTDETDGESINHFTITGKPTIIYTSYEIIKGGGG